MFGPQSRITNPFGVTVFGSSVSRVAPDLAIIKAAVAVLEQKPGDAFARARKTAIAVQAFLRGVPHAEFGTSRTSLTREFRYTDGQQKFVGYKAVINFRLRLKDLDRVETIAEALINAGANELASITYETSRLAEIRAEARREAVGAAYTKAQNYCAAAGVTLGAVLHIEDVNPDVLQGAETRAGGARGGVPDAAGDDEGAALDPSLVEVGAAVMIAYGLAKADAA